MMKPDMVDAAKADTGTRKAWNHNEADAYLCARLAGRFWHYAEDDLTDDALTPVERHLFTQTHTYKRGKRAGQTTRTGLVFREDDRFFRWSDLPTVGVNHAHPVTEG
jgi:hypothetical protein